MHPQAKPSSRRERKKERTRQEAYAAAMRLFAERSYHQVTVEEICEEADVAAQAFPSTDSIMLAAAAERRAELSPEELRDEFLDWTLRGIAHID